MGGCKPNATVGMAAGWFIHGGFGCTRTAARIWGRFPLAYGLIRNTPQLNLPLLQKIKGPAMWTNRGHGLQGVRRVVTSWHWWLNPAHRIERRDPAAFLATANLPKVKLTVLPLGAFT